MELQAATLGQISSCLRLPLTELRRVLGQNQRFLAELERRRNQRQSSSSLRRHLAKFHCPQLEAFQLLNSFHDGSRLIASYHFGDFVYGLNHLLRQDLAKRRSRVQTMQSSSETYFRNMAMAFSDQEADQQCQLPMDQTPLSALHHAVRELPTNLVLFADLPPGFGASCPVKLLGRDATLPRGVATIALRNGLPILPVICLYRGGRHEQLLFPQIETNNCKWKDKKQAISCICQQLADILSLALEQYPQQWRYLSCLPAYFHAVQHPLQDRANPNEGITTNSWHARDEAA